MQDRTKPCDPRPRLILLEENPLTAWAIEQRLGFLYQVIRCPSLEAVEHELGEHSCSFVVCGSPLADEQPEAVLRLAARPGLRVVALVSDVESPLRGKLPALEKPFVLTRLLELLSRSEATAAREIVYSGQQARNGRREIMAPLLDRLYGRFEKEICPKCVHRTADGRCTLTEQRDCPVFEWARQLSVLCRGVESDRLGDYLNQIQAIICPNCAQQPNGSCKARDHLNCPLDLYLGLVIPIIEEELKRCSAP